MRLAFYISIFLMIATGCAIQSSPEGGPKDESPPEIISTTPENKSTNFSASEIVIEFDEYVQLKNFTGQFFSSPPLKERVDYKLKGKRLYLFINEELQTNTTYTFSFGAAIEDITENNPQAAFKYVFATGDVLDSLAVSGVVQDAYTGNPEEGLIAMLYPKNTPDSSLLATRPSYYSITDEQGNFSVENLAVDTFKLIVIKDENLNLMYDVGSDKVGFHSNDVVSGTELSQPIQTYVRKVKTALLESGQKGYGKILLSFSNDVTNPAVSIIGGEIFPTKREQTYIEMAGGGDSVYFWYNAAQYPEDMNFVFLNVQTDSVQADSVRVILREAKAPKLTMSVLKSNAIGPLDTILLESPVPIFSIDETLIRVEQDSVPVPFQLHQSAPRTLKLWFEKKQGEFFTAYFDKESLTDLFGRMNDSTSNPIKVAAEADMAILKMNLSATDSSNKIFELIDENGDVVRKEVFSTELKYTQNFVQPGGYGIRIIWDTNKNLKWDAGNYSKRIQPEQVAYYLKPIELRANWELEVEWEIPEP